MATKGGPSPHLTWAELACHDGTAYPARWRETRAAALAEAFEAVRELAGGLPLFVTSGYRTAAWNQRIGGAAKSQHVQGRAVDVVPAKGCSIEELAVAAAAVR
ncbi:MAG: D-Ala-D-Ala carboxypeptidase family metallohydrolase, partial [Armatimonadota bacterium]|nr:D-Ala-D-Ala carboxypeptidase family metallohydrolase [Armatimonadota bacterium]